MENSKYSIAAGEGRALRFSAGESFKIIDVDGGQVGDLFAFNANDTEEFASAPHTRSIIKRLFPRPGDSIYTNLRFPILALEQDCSPGRHDTLYAACDPRRYENFGITGAHRSCASNLAEAMVEHGGLKVPVPQPFNLFMEVQIDRNGNLNVTQATSKAGDFLIFRALLDTVVVLSSCPFDVYRLNSGGVTPLAIESF